MEDEIKIFRIRSNSELSLYKDSILAILKQASGVNLTDEEKREQGFVQGSMDEALLSKAAIGSGVFIVSIKDELVAVAITFTPQSAIGGPISLAYEKVLHDKAINYQSQDIFFYGPVVVKPLYRGRGLLTMLLKNVSAQLYDTYKLGIAFVDQDNVKSLSIHRHYPMNEYGSFAFHEHNYSIFTFELSTILEYYNMT